MSRSGDEATAVRDARVLVTGASGFLGRPLCRRLLELGAEVIGVSRSAQSESDLARWIEADVGAPDEASRVIAETRPDLVFHLASVVSGSRDRSVLLPTFRANLASTVYLLEAAAGVSCRRFVQIGSLEEPETPGEAPCSPYAAAKAAATGYARMCAELYGLPTVVARVFMVYGPGLQDTNKLVPYVITRLLRGQPIELSSGERPVDWIYVDDVVRGMVRLAVANGVDGRRVDLGSGSLVPVADVVRRLFQQLAPGTEPPLGTLPDRGGEPVRAASVAETERLIGWRPEVGLDAGLARTIDYFVERLA